MSISKDIVLRPRFKVLLSKPKDEVISDFKLAKERNKSFILTCIDDHIFIKIPRQDQHFWSPQLHLEIIEEDDKKNSTLHGLFGPNPTIWTFFMFLHFIVAGIFIGFTVWAYSNWSLDQPFIVQLSVCILMVLIWFVLYAAGRIGRSTGKDQMHDLYQFMNSVIEAEVSE